ncbi:hypothetical protein PRIPAC_94104 [Pristionchus pacificus]|uniref:Uncharacterized protein n=1 Tax=Pristionchus pacificus TaxID=54126 RepID=A0A2A6CID1_PRIPA|nr:hypothetical protein PRIPAC_94104 [Pristionchus pacificus]|eukprot:PDM77850.1 hypothetical protein PRIPAC_34717 [Pristionchus pacificus]
MVLGSGRHWTDVQGRLEGDVRVIVDEKKKPIGRVRSTSSITARIQRRRSYLNRKKVDVLGLIRLSKPSMKGLAMTDYMSAMLDELMGSARNANAGEKIEIDFNSPEICKDFISAFCPHDIFRNTKNDIGYCSLKHDVNAKKLYEESPRRYKCGYEERFLNRMDRDVRRKIEKNEKRLVITQTSNEEETFGKLKEAHEEKMREITKKIEEKMDEAEKAGSEGNVNLAQSVVEEADKLREESALLEAESRNMMERFHHLEDVANSLNKPMKVCQICGCFMLVNDAQSRIDDHFSGKLHIAYATIRDILETLPKTLEEKKKEGRSEKDRADREREKERGGDGRDKERDQREKDRRSRSRDRRDRDRDSRGSSDRRDRDRGGDRRDRSRDRRDRR